MKKNLLLSASFLTLVFTAGSLQAYQIGFPPYQNTDTISVTTSDAVNAVIFTNTDTGTITIQTDNAAKLTNTAGGTLYNAGTLNNLTGGILANTGTLNNAGLLNNLGVLDNDGTLNSSGAFRNSNTLNNTGTLNNGAILDSFGTLNNQRG